MFPGCSYIYLKYVRYTSIIDTFLITGYDLEANLALLKLYQFNPTHTDMKEEKKFHVVCFHFDLVSSDASV